MTPEYRAPAFTVEVRGLPVPQGSIRSLGAGRPSVHSNAKSLLPWRESVQHAIEYVHRSRPVITGPVAIQLVFTMPKPKSAPKRKRTWATSRPDIDKLARAILDATTNAGAIRDDAQVVELTAVKTFPAEHPDALDSPGVLIRLTTITAEPAQLEDQLEEIPW